MYVYETPFTDLKGKYKKKYNPPFNTRVFEKDKRKH